MAGTETLGIAKAAMKPRAKPGGGIKSTRKIEIESLVPAGGGDL